MKHYAKWRRLLKHSNSPSICMTSKKAASIHLMACSQAKSNSKWLDRAIHPSHDASLASLGTTSSKAAYLSASWNKKPRLHPRVQSGLCQRSMDLVNNWTGTTSKLIRSSRGQSHQSTECLRQATSQCSALLITLLLAYSMKRLTLRNSSTSCRSKHSQIRTMS